MVYSLSHYSHFHIHLCVCVQVEQYGNLIFHGLEGSCQEYIANLVARCIKVRPPVDKHQCRTLQAVNMEC